jgi:tetratricopeptide (TPR) repeat protein
LNSLFAEFGNNAVVIMVLIAVLMLGGFFILFHTLVFLSKQKKVDISEDLLKKGEYGKVLEELKDVVNNNSGTYLQMHYIAQAFEGMGNLEKAIDFYEKCIVRMPLTESDFKDIVFMKIARLYLKLKKHKEALGFFETVLAKKTTSRYVYYEISQVYFEMKKYSNAQKNLETYLRFAPKDINAQLLLAKTYYYTNSYQKSINILVTLQHALKKLGADKVFDGKVHLARAYMHLKQYTRALEVFDTLLSEEFNVNEFFRDYFYALCGAGQTDAAEIILSDNMPRLSSPVRQELSYQLAVIYWQKDKFREAVSLWKGVYRENPGFKDVNNIVKCYSPLMESQVYDMLFLNHVSAENQLKNLLSIPHTTETIKRENFWIMYHSDKCYIINLKLNPFSFNDLEECDSLIQTNKQSSNDCTLLSYRYVDERAKTAKIFKTLRIISSSQFINFFRDKLEEKTAPEYAL